MWKVCLGQLSELQQEALQQALEAESWLNPQPWTRARYPTCRSLTKTASHQQRFLELFAWNAPIFCWPPVMKTEGLWFCIEWKQTNTTKYTEMDRREQHQLILFFYICGWRLWTMKSGKRIQEKQRKNGEKCREDWDSNNKKDKGKKTMTRE